MMPRQINPNQNALKDRIGFIFYIGFDSKIGKSIRKKGNNGQKKLRLLSQNLLKSQLVLPNR